MLFFKRVALDIVLLADNRPTLGDRLQYFFNIFITAGPIVLLLQEFNLWFIDNKQFVTFVTIAIIINMFVGIWYHVKMKSFNWEMFMKRNSVMVFVLIITYVLLEQTRITIGKNAAGEVLKVVFQLATLLYPTSKALKNIYILTNKQHPPSFIMEKLYNFEKSGNLKELIKTGMEKEEAEYYAPTEDKTIEP